MAQRRDRQLFFVSCQSGVSSSTGGQLNAEARAHAWRQSTLKAGRQARGLKFISYPAKITHASDRVMAAKKQAGEQEKLSACTDPATSIPRSPPARALMDPFGTLAVPDPTRGEEFLLSYAFHRTLPVFGESDLERQVFAQSWATRAKESPMVFAAQIHSAATHYLISSSIVHGANRIFSDGLRRKIQAIQALRAEIGRHQPDPTGVNNDLLLTIFILAIHGGLARSDQREPHPLSPLATHRDLNVYGRMSFSDEHTNALYYLIEQIGGLSCVDQSVFGYVAPIWDMFNSSRVGYPPRFACARQHESLLHNDLWKPDEAAMQMLTTLGECFRQGPDGTWPEFLDEDMRQPLLDMVEITVALDHFCRGDPGAPKSLDVLLNNCDCATHSVLSIRPYGQKAPSGLGSDQDPDPSLTTCLHEICRLAALLYVDMVILPTPPHTGIKIRHAKSMLRLIKVIEKGRDFEDPRVIDFLTWATFLGAIAARFTETQLQYLHHIEIMGQKTDWNDIHTRLERSLWFGPVCDEPAASLWLEAHQR